MIFFYFISSNLAINNFLENCSYKYYSTYIIFKLNLSDDNIILFTTFFFVNSVIARTDILNLYVIFQYILVRRFINNYLN